MKADDLRSMTIDQCAQWAATVAKVSASPTPERLSYLGLGLAGEAGEVADLIKKLLRDGKLDGMQDFDSVIKDFIEREVVTLEDGLSFATNPNNLQLALKGMSASDDFMASDAQPVAARLEEDLKEALGQKSLYNEALGTVSTFYLYDRVQDRDRGVPKRVWE